MNDTPNLEWLIAVDDANETPLISVDDLLVTHASSEKPEPDVLRLSPVMFG